MITSWYLLVTLKDGQKFTLDYDKGTLESLYRQMRREKMNVEWGKTTRRWHVIEEPV